jgi:hypothetical protein
MDIQASVALPINGGTARASVENFRHRNVFSFRYAESSVVGSFSAKDNAYGTASTSVIEGVNILDVVTCDRIVNRITSKHDKGSTNLESSYIVYGTYIENLRIGGYKIELDLATDMLSEYSTWDKLNQAYSSDPATRAEIDKLSYIPGNGTNLPVSKTGTFGCTLARPPAKLPGGLVLKGHSIYVPHFGTVHLCEYFASQYQRRLQMLHVDLGCSTEGCGGFSGSGGNGIPFP